MVLVGFDLGPVFSSQTPLLGDSVVIRGCIGGRFRLGVGFSFMSLSLPYLGICGELLRVGEEQLEFSTGMLRKNELVGFIC